MKQLQFGDWDITLKTDKLTMVTVREKGTDFTIDLIVLDQKQMIHAVIGLDNNGEVVIQPMTLKCVFQISYGRKEVEVKLRKRSL